MAHEIDQTVNPMGAFIARLKSAWHGLGEVRPNWLMSDILAHPGIGFQVSLDKIQTEHGVEIPGRFATVRQDTNQPLGVVGSDYTVLQHTDEFGLFDEELSKFGYVYETAGVLRGGAQVFLLARRPESWEVVPGDDMREFVLLSFSYDGKTCQRVKAVNERVVCANTHAIALNEEGSRFDYAIRHTASIEERMADVRDSLVTAAEAFGHFRIGAYQLVNSAPSRRLFQETMDNVSVEAFGRMPNDSELVPLYMKKINGMVDEITELIASPNQTIGGIKDTSWSLYNAISEWADHSFAVGSRGSERERAERRFTSVLQGHAHDIKQTAWTTLLAA